jgi:hypothetical protein
MTGASLRALRAVAGSGAILAGWLALDSFRSGILGAGGAEDMAFVVFWGLPLATLSVFLAWVALRGGDAGTRRVAGSGCLGALFVGGSVVAILLASPLILSWDVLRGAVSAVQLAPLAGMLGGLGGLGLAGMQKRRR